MRAVPRHLFVPEASLEQAYGPDSVVTFRDGDGVAISSASGPRVVAGMLDQLGSRPGDRVLEVGAGTGYNAACLAELVGPDGSVTAVDIGADIVARPACSCGGGYQRVRVVHGDGAVGVPDAAPYDRIMVQGHALQAGLVEPIYSWGSMGCCTSDTFAYLTRRPAPSDAGKRWSSWERARTGRAPNRNPPCGQRRRPGDDHGGQAAQPGPRYH